MDAETALNEAWGSYKPAIRDCMVRLSEAPMPEEADFLCFVLLPHDLHGIPVIVCPTEWNQQPHDGWAHEEDLTECVPETVELPNLAGSPEQLDELRDACAAFLMSLWRAIEPIPERLAYFSLSDDGWYFSLRDGRRISSWDIETEIRESLAGE